MIVVWWLTWPALAIAGEVVRVTEPYLDLRTGPGRGYPVYYIAERGQSVEVLRRHTDWFQVRTPSGHEGWVAREDIEKTVTDSGTRISIQDVLFDDYRRRRFEFGFAAGQFERDPSLTIYAGYRLHENLLAELAIGESSGSFSTTSLIYASLVSQPYPESRWSPYLSLGVGRFDNRAKATLVSARDVQADLATMGVGLRYYVTRQFFVRAEFREHVALINHNRNETYQERSIGVAFFF
jgi:hypothetical protein